MFQFDALMHTLNTIVKRKGIEIIKNFMKYYSFHTRSLKIKNEKLQFPASAFSEIDLHKFFFKNQGRNSF